MHYCKYHPTKSATYHCENCHMYVCDLCVDDNPATNTVKCLLCGNPVDSLGARYNAEPFWRRLQASFHYPLNTETSIFVIGIAILFTLASFFPFTVLWYLLLIGAFMKYCFCCLEKTSTGLFKSPDITAAYGGGIILAVQLVLIVVFISAFLFLTNMWLGKGVATFIGGLIVFCIPAMLINFALTESMLEALNPLKMLYLIAAIGFPYGVLLGLIVVMIGSVSFINELIGNSFSLLSITLRSIVSNYYTIVVFHLMGYMIFQYQGELGFIAREAKEQPKNEITKLKKVLSKIDINVKEGNYDDALLIFRKAIKDYPNNKEVYNRCFNFLLAIKNKKLIEDYAEVYFKFLKDTNREDQLTVAFKKIQHVHSEYMPKTAGGRLMLAYRFNENGDFCNAVKLLNNLNKVFPDFRGLDQYYQLLSDTLNNIPGMKEKADLYASEAKRHKQEKRKITAKNRKNFLNASLEQQHTISDAEKQSSEEDSIRYDKGIDFN